MKYKDMDGYYEDFLYIRDGDEMAPWDECERLKQIIDSYLGYKQRRPLLTIGMNVLIDDTIYIPPDIHFQWDNETRMFWELIPMSLDDEMWELATNPIERT